MTKVTTPTYHYWFCTDELTDNYLRINPDGTALLIALFDERPDARAYFKIEFDAKEALLQFKKPRQISESAFNRIRKIAVSQIATTFYPPFPKS